MRSPVRVSRWRRVGTAGTVQVLVVALLVVVVHVSMGGVMVQVVVVFCAGVWPL